MCCAVSGQGAGVAAAVSLQRDEALDQLSIVRCRRNWRGRAPLPVSQAAMLPAQITGGVMIRSRRQRLVCAFLLAVVSVTTAQAQNYTKPKVRAITGFVRLNPADYAQQIAEALAVLREARAIREARVRSRKQSA